MSLKRINENNRKTHFFNTKLTNTGCNDAATGTSIEVDGDVVIGGAGPGVGSANGLRIILTIKILNMKILYREINDSILLMKSRFQFIIFILEKKKRFTSIDVFVLSIFAYECGILCIFLAFQIKRYFFLFL